MSRRITRPARELLILLLARGPLEGDGDSVAMKELRQRGLVRQVGCRIDVTPQRARRVETYELTLRGVQVAEQLSKNRAGHDLCWELK